MVGAFNDNSPIKRIKDKIMNKYIAYLRVSTEKQSLENQKHKIYDYAYNNDIKIDRFVEIEISSRKEQKLRLIEELFESLEEL